MTKSNFAFCFIWMRNSVYNHDGRTLKIRLGYNAV
jgi:hypothetical protein